MFFEVECIDRNTKQVVVSTRVASFALAREIARHLVVAVGSRVIVRKCKPEPPSRYDVWLWCVDEKEWTRLRGKPLHKSESAEFFLRFDRGDAVPVFWPVGFELPSRTSK